MGSLELYNDLLARNFTFHVDKAGLHPKPYNALTPEDCAAIRDHKADLLALIATEKDEWGPRLTTWMAEQLYCDLANHRREVFLSK
jgi:hypothetical protein